jgi:hypothetical protein
MIALIVIGVLLLIGGVLFFALDDWDPHGVARALITMFLMGVGITVGCGIVIGRCSARYDLNPTHYHVEHKP